MKFALLGAIFLSLLSVTYKVAPSLKEKKICLFEVLVDYNGSNDILVSRYRCDGEDPVVFESKKIEGDKFLLDEVPRMGTQYGKKFLEEGFKTVSCGLTPPVTGVRYYSRYSCTFSRQ